METNHKNEKEEIIKYLNQIGIRVDKSVLDNPNSNQVIELYVSLLSHHNLINKDSLKIIPEELKNFSDSSGCEYYVRFTKTYIFAKYIFKNIIECNENFNIGDLLNPTSKRTKFFFVKLIKYCKKIENNNNSIEPYIKEYRQLKEVKSSRNLKINEAQVKKKKMTDQFQSDIDKYKKYEATLKEKELGNSNLEIVCNKEISKTKEIQNSIEEVKNKNDLLIKSLQQATQDLEELDAKYVHSPEKTLKYAEEIKQRCENALKEKNEIEEKNKSYNDLIPKFHSLNESLNLYDKTSRIEQETSLLNNEINNKIECIQESIESKQVEFQNKSKEIEDQLKLSSELKQQYEKAQKNNLIEIEKMNNQKGIILNQINVQKLSQKNKIFSINQLNKDIEDTNASINEIKNVKIEYEKNANETLQKLLEESSEYSKKIFVLLKHNNIQK